MQPGEDAPDTPFRNAAVDPTSLPALAQAALAPVARHYAPYRALGRVAGGLPLAAAAALAALAAGLPAAAAGALGSAVALAVLLSTGLVWLEARRRAWGLREHDLIYRRGLLVQRLTALPFVRLQHVETVSGPLERAFGLVRLRCYTAGGASADLVLEGLERGDAARVREFLLARIGAGRD